MYNFASDYLEGAHPQVMEALNKTNFIQTVGYGEDQYCQKAKDKIKAILENENVDIHFLVGGTQTNMIMISSALKDYQAVIAVDSGHINVHETGAVEFMKSCVNILMNIWCNLKWYIFHKQQNMVRTIL